MIHLFSAFAAPLLMRYMVLLLIFGSEPCLREYALTELRVEIQAGFIHVARQKLAESATKSQKQNCGTGVSMDPLSRKGFQDGAEKTYNIHEICDTQIKACQSSFLSAAWQRSLYLGGKRLMTSLTIPLGIAPVAIGVRVEDWMIKKR